MVKNNRHDVMLGVAAKKRTSKLKRKYAISSATSLTFFFPPLSRNTQPDFNMVKRPYALHHHVKLPRMFPFSTGSRFLSVPQDCSFQRCVRQAPTPTARVQNPLAQPYTTTYGRSVAFLLELKVTPVAPSEPGPTDMGHLPLIGHVASEESGGGIG